MKVPSVLTGIVVASWAIAQTPTPVPTVTPEPTPTPFLSKRYIETHTTIDRHLGRPYVWGASGLKSFDCSGFLWRVMWENGIFIKRTTARKFFVSLPRIEKDKQYEFSVVVFFDDLEHVGIVNSKDSFFHSARTLGTHESKFDPYWRPKIFGFRLLPFPPTVDTEPMTSNTPVASPTPIIKTDAESTPTPSPKT